MTPLNDLYITGGDNCGALMKLGNRVERNRALLQKFTVG